MKILIADQMHVSLLPMLEAYGWHYDYQPDFRRNDIISSLAGYDGLMIRSKTRIDEELLTQATRLKFIARAGAGLDLIDLDATARMNIRLFHAGTGNRDAVAEHVLGMLLSLFNNLNRADREVRQAIWDREGNRGVELMGKTVGLIGYGNNGTATAQRLSGFGCRVLAYDKYRTDYGDAHAEASTLSEIQQNADVLSLHVPLTELTSGMVDTPFIADFVKPFYLVNASRGEIVHTAALVTAMKAGQVLGTCLDVLENEKLSQLTNPQQAAFDYLRQSPRTLLTPHIAGWTHESYVRINEVLVEQIAEWVEKG